ncbi:MAG: ABC transporter substrate-binding protein [Nocardioides sp.]|nr:ABC transporter substrate-binding protein [Nocardioides sp.]
MTSPRLLLALPALALAVTGCGSSTGSDSDAIQIVATTNVYGDVAQAIAGDRVEVTSIITSAAQDPHEYEATARDRLAVDDADLVIENGGGYDSYMDTLLDGAEPSALITAVDVSGLLDEDHAEDDHEEDDHADEDHADEAGHEGHDHVEGFNEHVWYDVHAVDAVARAIADDLAEIDPAGADTYEANYQAFAGELEALESTADDLRSGAEGDQVAITEPVPLYLLEEVGLVNETPEEFSEAVEEGTDVAPRVLQETLDLVGGGNLALLAYNEQTADSTTEEVRTAAEEAGVPVVDFTETLPDGETYVTWQQSNLDAIAAALG